MLIKKWNSLSDYLMQHGRGNWPHNCATFDNDWLDQTALLRSITLCGTWLMEQSLVQVLAKAVTQTAKGTGSGMMDPKLSHDSMMWVLTSLSCACVNKRDVLRCPSRSRQRLGVLMQHSSQVLVKEWGRGVRRETAPQASILHKWCIAPSLTATRANSFVEDLTGFFFIFLP